MNRLDQYKQVLDELNIDPDDTSYSGGEDAGLHVSGEVPLERYCVVTQGGEFTYAKAIWDTLEGAKASAMENVTDEVFQETPVAIIDLDTGERIEPDYDTVQWRKAVAQ